MMRGVSIRCGGRARWAALKWSERTCATPASPSLVEVNAQLWEGVPRRWVQYAAVGQLRTKGHPVSEQDAARLSPLGHAHVNELGRYAFPALTPDADLRPLRDPQTADDEPPA